MTNLNDIVGMHVDKALSLLDGKQVKITDFSRPDKYHLNSISTLRVVKAIQSENCIELFVAGFVDDVNDRPEQ